MVSHALPTSHRSLFFLNCHKQVVLSHWSVIFRPFNNGKYHRDYSAIYLDYTHWSWSFCLLGSDEYFVSGGLQM